MARMTQAQKIAKLEAENARLKAEAAEKVAKTATPYAIVASESDCTPAQLRAASRLGLRCAAAAAAHMGASSVALGWAEGSVYDGIPVIAPWKDKYASAGEGRALAGIEGYSTRIRIKLVSSTGRTS